MIKVYSYNCATEEKELMGVFETREEAEAVTTVDNIEIDNDEFYSDYQVLFTEDDVNFEIFIDFTVEMDDDDFDDFDDELGYNPYLGCFDWDC